jgi:hypothetical protein
MVEMISLGELAEAGGVEAFARAAAERARAEERASWLPMLEAWAAGLTGEDDPLAWAYLDGEIRRLRRLLRLPPVPSPEAVERRRELTRARVRRHRERRRLLR